MSNIDQFLNMDLMSEIAGSPALTSTSLPAIVGDDPTLDSNGMTFAEMFRHDVGKLHPSLSPFPSPSVNTANARSSAFNEFPMTFIDPTDVYALPAMLSPFLPTVHGSPIENFSPSSEISSNLSNGYFGFDEGDSLMEIVEGTSPIRESSIISAHREDDEIKEEHWAIDPRLVGFSDSPEAPGLSTVVEPIPAGRTTRSRKIVVSKSPPVRRAALPIAGEEEEEEDEMVIKDEEMEAEDTSPPVVIGTRSLSSKVKISPSASPVPTPFIKKKASTQKIAKTSVLPFATAELHVTSSRSTLGPVPDWTDKPDPDTYKALGSKEKRQLRNKISARNFRHRRKEYITTLEEEIAGRDTIIGQLQSEVGTLRDDNKDLQSEVETLKEQWAEMMAKMTNLSVASLASPSSRSSPPPLLSKAPIPSTSASTTTTLPVAPVTSTRPMLSLSSLPPLPPLNFARASLASLDDWPLASPPIASGSGTSSRPSRPSLSITKPNLSKDMAPGSSKRNGSWTTSASSNYMPIHTMRMLNEVNPKHFSRSLSSQDIHESDFPFPSSSISSSSISNQSLSGKAPRDYPLYRFTTSDLLDFQSPKEAHERRIQYFDALARSMIVAASGLMEQVLLLAIGSIGSETIETEMTRFGQC